MTYNENFWFAIVIRKIIFLAVEMAPFAALPKKNTDLSKWYSQVLIQSKLIEYYDVSGCYIIQPNAYNIWHTIQCFFNAHLEDNNIDLCYFPMFVNYKHLMKEQDHLEGFKAEVACVLPPNKMQNMLDPQNAEKVELTDMIAIRPYYLLLM